MQQYKKIIVINKITKSTECKFPPTGWLYSGSNSCRCAASCYTQDMLLSLTEGSQKKNMLDSKWCEQVMLRCSLVIKKKKRSAAYQMKPHLKEPCFCRTPRPSAAYPGSPSWTYPGFLSCTPRSVSPRLELPPALGWKWREGQGGGEKDKTQEKVSDFSLKLKGDKWSEHAE